MATISLRSMNSRLDLLASCVNLMKSIWPHCRADRLHRLAVEETTGLPCSLILIQHGETVPDKVIGHVRLVPVTKPDTPKSVYIESLCVEKSRQAMGYGKEVMHFAQRYAAMILGIRQIHMMCLESKRGFYEGLSYKEYHGPRFETVGANLLRSSNKGYSWDGNHPQPGWETVYDGGPILSEEAIRALGSIPMMKDLQSYVQVERHIQQPGLIQNLHKIRIGK